MNKNKEKIVRTKLGVKIMEIFGWKYLCKILSYKTWKVTGYIIYKN